LKDLQKQKSKDMKEGCRNKRSNLTDAEAERLRKLAEPRQKHVFAPKPVTE